MDNTKEYIICSAYLLRVEYMRPPETWTNYKQQQLWDKYGKYDDIYRCILGRRHNDILQRYKGKLIDDGGGFYTSWGRYVTREEAANIVIDCGQCIPFNSKKLFSEDLY